MFDLPMQGDGAKLQSMVGAIIYIRVSTKEQTENLAVGVNRNDQQLSSRGIAASRSPVAF